MGKVNGPLRIIIEFPRWVMQGFARRLVLGIVITSISLFLTLAAAHFWWPQ
jgi:hypothetical protein